MPQSKTPPRGKPEAPNDADHRDAALDEALEESFPASDPVAISVDHEPTQTADRRNQQPGPGKRTR